MGIIGTSCTINYVLFIYLFIQLYLHLSKGENPGMQFLHPKIEILKTPIMWT